MRRPPCAPSTLVQTEVVAPPPRPPSTTPTVTRTLTHYRMAAHRAPRHALTHTMILWAATIRPLPRTCRPQPPNQIAHLTSRIRVADRVVGHQLVARFVTTGRINCLPEKLPGAALDVGHSASDRGLQPAVWNDHRMSTTKRKSLVRRTLLLCAASSDN